MGASIGLAVAVACLGAWASEGVEGAARAGGVSYAGEQRAIVETGQASARVSLAELSGMPHLYAVGAVAGLDGEITVLDSQSYVSKVRWAAESYEVDRTFDHRAVFLVWAQVPEWDGGVAVPPSVSNYGELEAFVKETAGQKGIDTGNPFPFLITGTPGEVVWHINVDRSGGKPITQESFWKSKQQYTLTGERVDAFGVYSEKHGGTFVSQGLRSHVHFVSRDGAATGHVDAIAPAGLTLRLPASHQAMVSPGACVYSSGPGSLPSGRQGAR